MKRSIMAVKIVIFILLFIFFIFAAQNVLYHKSGSMIPISRYHSYMNEPPDSIDLLFLGTSSIDTGIIPMVLYHESGMTSINLGMANNTAFLNYYQLQFALKTQTPKLVVLDLCSLFEERKIASYREAPYRNAIDNMPFCFLKLKMLITLLKDNPEQDPLSWFFPLFRYHGRWDELTKSDFISYAYPDYRKGFRPLTTTDKGLNFKRRAHFDPEPTEYNAYSYDYYMKILDLCKEKDIDVAVISFPRTLTETLIGQYKAITLFCEEQDIPYYNFNTNDAWRWYNINGKTDFYDSWHLNVRGAIKLSTALSQILAEDFNLPDHRGDADFADWNKNWDAFYDAYMQYFPLEIFSYYNPDVERFSESY